MDIDLEILTGGQLAKYERETVINFNELENYTTIYTSSRSILTKCNKAGYEVVFSDSHGTKFKCPKKCIGFGKANKKPRKPMSEEHKVKLLKSNPKINQK